MLSTDNRFAAAKRRAVRYQRTRRDLRLLVLSGGLCLAALVGVALLLPGEMLKFTRQDMIYRGSAGSLFSLSGAAGYVVIGVLAFALGVCFALLCLFLRRRREIDHRRDKFDD